MNDLHAYCLDLAQRAKVASGELARASGGQKQQWLQACARLLDERAAALAEANQLDLAAAPGLGLALLPEVKRRDDATVRESRRAV